MIHKIRKKQELSNKIAAYIKVSNVVLMKRYQEPVAIISMVGININGENHSYDPRKKWCLS